MPESTATFEEILAEWQNAATEASKWNTKEKELRLALFGGACPTPKEGVNNITLQDGRICKFTHKLNRSVTNPVECRTELAGAGVNDLDAYVKTKYELAIKGYKEAPPEVREILDKYVTTKPGMPTLEVK